MMTLDKLLLFLIFGVIGWSIVVLAVIWLSLLFARTIA